MKRKQNNKVLPHATGTDRKSRGRNKPGVMMPVPTPLQEMPENYGEFLAKLKKRISRERIKAILSANSALVLMYWDIGQSILERQHNEGWGAKIIDRLSHDLKTAFPDMSGFSPRNLKYMRKFAESWPDKAIVQEVLAQITWYHNLALLEKNKEPEVRLWYARKTIENGWSRNILAIQIETHLYERQGRTINNFPAALPPADSAPCVIPAKAGIHGINSSGARSEASALSRSAEVASNKENIGLSRCTPRPPACVHRTGRSINR